MEKPTIPKSPASRPPAIVGRVPGLNRSKSEVRVGEASKEKRVRLRDYLFIASTSSQRNSEKKQDIKNSVIEKDTLKSSISLLKRNKYGLPNAEMYAIVKAEITKEMAAILEELQQKLAALSSETVPNPTSEDLNYLYNVKRVMTDSMRLALREMDELTFRKNRNVIKEIINMGLAFKNEAIKEENEDDSRHEEKPLQSSSMQFIEALFGNAGKA